MTVTEDAPTRPRLELTAVELRDLGIVELRALARQHGVPLSRDQYARRSTALEAILAAAEPAEPAELVQLRAALTGRYGANRSSTNYAVYACGCPGRTVRTSTTTALSGVRHDACGRLFLLR